MDDREFWLTIRRAILMAEGKSAIPVDLRPSALMIAAAIEKRYTVAQKEPELVIDQQRRQGLTADLPPLRGLTSNWDR